MNTDNLIKEIMNHPELHDLITHLGDFHEAVIEKRDSVLEDREGILAEGGSWVLG